MRPKSGRSPRPTRPKRGRSRRVSEGDFVRREDFVVVEEGEDHAEAAEALSDSTLIEIVKNNGSLISHAVQRLIKSYESKPDLVFFEILKMLFEACGTTVDIQADDLNELNIHDIISKLQGKGLVDSKCNSGQVDLKSIKENLDTFWDSLVLESQNGPLFDDNFFPTICNYVVVISCMKPLVYRKVATTIGLQLVTSFISITNTHAEKKKNCDTPADKSRSKRLYDDMTCLQKLTMNMFIRLFVRRYADADPEIRMSCIKALGSWIVLCPSVFLQDIYLKYLGWALDDKNAGVRRTTVLALQSLYVDAYVPSLGTFTERFKKKMLKLAHDRDDTVLLPAIIFMKQLLRHEFVTDDEVAIVYELVIDASPAVRQETATFLYEQLISQSINTSSGAQDGDESSQVHISRMLEILRECPDDPILCSYILDGIWNEMKDMENWNCIISMLLDETPIPDVDERTIHDVDETNLVRMLQASAKKAVGERVILTMDNSKIEYDESRKEIIENRRSEITIALMKIYPQLLKKCLPLPSKISPLIDIIKLLKLEMYLHEEQEQNFKDAIDLIAVAFFKHGDQFTLKSCIDAIAFCCAKCQADLLVYAKSKLKSLEDQLVLDVKTAIRGVEAADDESSLLVNLKRLHALHLVKPVENDVLFGDMDRILGKVETSEVKSLLLMNMFFQVAWCVDSINIENPSETSINEVLSKQGHLFDQLYYFLEVLPSYQKDERNTIVLSCRVCIITAEMWCLFKKSKYSSMKLKNLGYLPRLDVVQKFWELCERQLNISDEEVDENAEYIEETNKDVVLIAAARLLLSNAVSKDYLGPEIISHYVSHGASTAEIVKNLIIALQKDSNNDMSVLFFAALKRVYERGMAYSHDGEKENLIAKSYTECEDLANQIAACYVGIRGKKRSEMSRIIKSGVQFVFEDLPKRLSFLEAALMPFVSKLPLSDIPEILTDVQERANDKNMTKGPNSSPCLTFVEQLQKKLATKRVRNQ